MAKKKNNSKNVSPPSKSESADIIAKVQAMLLEFDERMAELRNNGLISEKEVRYHTFSRNVYASDRPFTSRHLRLLSELMGYLSAYSPVVVDAPVEQLSLKSLPLFQMLSSRKSMENILIRN